MTKKLIIEPVEKEDSSFLHEMFNNPDIVDYWFIEPYTTKYKIEQDFEKHYDSETNRQFILKFDGEKVGLVALYGIDTRHRNAEFAIMIHPDHQGKGYAKAATKLTIDYGFRKLNLHKVYLVVAASNERAIVSYEKVGFQHEATFKEEYFINGKYEDAHYMSIFQRDYFN